MYLAPTCDRKRPEEGIVFGHRDRRSLDGVARENLMPASTQFARQGCGGVQQHNFHWVTSGNLVGLMILLTSQNLPALPGL
jgi:hypothetical protein